MYYLLDDRKAMNIVYVKIMSKFILRQYINLADKKNTSKYISLHHNWMRYHKNRAQHWLIFSVIRSHYNYQPGYYSKNYFDLGKCHFHCIQVCTSSVVYFLFFESVLLCFSFYLWSMEHILKLSKILKCYDIWTGLLIF